MRLSGKFGSENEERSREGSLLLAHPSLSDGCFDRSVVWVIAHSSEDGAIGVIVNRPLQITLGEYNRKLHHAELASVPLFYGGPVDDRRVTLVAWKQADETGTLKFYFGIDESKACELIADDQGFEVRGFLGYSGWGQGQLENELKTDSWVVAELSTKLSALNSPNAWKSLMVAENPLAALLALAPRNPSLN